MNAVLIRSILVSLREWADHRWQMAEPRKVFRIEETAAARLRPSVETAHDGLRHAEIVEELRALRAALAGSALSSPLRGGLYGESSRLSSELNLIAGAIRGGNEAGIAQAPSAEADAPNKAMPRIAHELNAVVEGTERATQKILAAAEEIDAAANNLSAALNGRLEQDLAQDIRDSVIKIFEACNFQDLIGQRVAKVLATLTFVEDHIGLVLEEIKTAAASRRRYGMSALHGPRLNGDPGHASQDDVDALFDMRQMENGGQRVTNGEWRIGRANTIRHLPFARYRYSLPNPAAG